MEYQPLTREEVASVIEGRSVAPRVPVLLHFWITAEDFGERAGEVRELLERYPQDAQIVPARLPAVHEAPPDDPEYRWVDFDAPSAPAAAVGIDERGPIWSWARLDSILEHFPDPRYGGLFSDAPADDGRYRLATWWYCLFERHWQLRGMTNALMDYYIDAENVHRLFRKITDFYLVLMERARNEHGCDGVFTSDDIGTQAGPFFGMEIFRAFFKPYYRELINKAHSLGMHFWLHSCGNIAKFMPEFVELGLDVLHPVQKYTMDEAVVARKYGRYLCVWSGFDVQRIIPRGTPDDVRREVRFLVDTFNRPEGRLMLTAGNAVKADCPVSSLEALFEESFRYGTQSVERYASSRH